MRKEDNDFYEKICKNIKQILNDLGMSITDLAEKIGDNPRVVSQKLLNNERKFTIRELYLVCKAIDCDFDEIVNGYAE